MLSSPYYQGFPGEPFKYLNLYEDAVIRLENLSPKESYSSETKRSMFVNNFTVINDTDQIMEQVKASIDTWDKMSNLLRAKLVRRLETSARTASRNTRINVSKLNLPTQSSVSNLKAVEIYLNVVKMNSGDRNIGCAFLDLSTNPQQGLLAKIKRKKKPMNSRRNQRYQPYSNGNKSQNRIRDSQPNGLAIVDTIFKKTNQERNQNKSANTNTTNISTENFSEEENSILYVEYSI